MIWIIAAILVGIAAVFFAVWSLKGKAPNAGKRDGRVLMGVVCLAVIISAVLILLNEQRIAAGSPVEDTDTGFFFWIPIWLVLFVPILRNKQKEPATPKQKRLLAIAVVVVVALVVITALAVLMRG